MIANTVFRIIVRVSRWLLTGNAAARPDSCPARRRSLCASLKYRDSAAHPKLINHPAPSITRSLSLSGSCQTTVP
jgi:hypothetical protein